MLINTHTETHAKLFVYEYSCIISYGKRQLIEIEVCSEFNKENANNGLACRIFT